jgi:hypothetical protein
MMAALAAAIALAPGLAEAAQSKKPRVNRNTQPEHIACTKYGCHPIPPNCTPATQLDFWGNPTGYDRIVCR